MPDWTSGETRRQAESREEYQRPKGKHRAQPMKPAQAGPSLPRALERRPIVLAAIKSLVERLQLDEADFYALCTKHGGTTLIDLAHDPSPAALDAILTALQAL